MAKFTGLEVWTDVACNGGTRGPAILPSDLVACEARFSLTGDEWLKFAISRNHHSAQHLSRGRVIRVCTTDVTLFDEWRICDFQDQSGGDVTLGVRCDPILVDLGRSLWADIDDDGQPYFDLSVGPATVTEILDAEVADANTDAGIDYITRGTVDQDTLIDAIAGEYLSARGIIELLRAKVASELRLRRNGTTDYKIDLLDEVGEGSTTYVQTKRNLMAFQRSRQGSALCTRATVKAASDGTHPGIGFARFLITSVNTSGQNYIRVQDERGAPYPGPIRFLNQLAGDVTHYVAEMAVAFSPEEITGTSVVDANTSQIEMTDASGFTPGRYVEFFTTNTAPGSRLKWLDNPVGQAAYGGIYTQAAKADENSGSINWVDNPRFDTWSNHSNPPDGYTLSAGSVTYEDDDALVLWSGRPVVALTTAATFRTSTIRLPDDSPYAYRFWVWLNLTGGLATPTIQVVRADTHADISSGGVSIVNPTNAWIAYPIELTDVGAAGGGCKIQVTWGTAAATLYIAAFGVQPLSWQRTDTYTPRANDCWHAANDHLEKYANPTAYRLSIADLDQLDNAHFSDDALVLGGTLSIYDTELGVTTSQRLLSFTRNYLDPLQTEVETGTPPRTLASILRERALDEEQVTARVATRIGESMVAAGAAITGTTEADNDLADAPTSSADQFIAQGKQLISDWKPKLSRRFAGVISET